MSSNQVKALIVVFILSVVAFFGIDLAKKRANYSENAAEEISLIDKMEQEGVPLFTSKKIDGTPVEFEKYKGKIILLNFWASWCDPCVREFPSMLKLVEHFKGEVVLVAVSNDEKKEDIENFIQAMKANQPNIEILWDENYKVANLYGTTKLPETYLIGRDLKLIRKIVGIDDWYTKDAIAYMETLVKKPVQP